MTIKQLLEAERRLGAIIDALEPHKNEMVPGAFQFLTTTENLLQNQRAKLEKGLPENERLNGSNLRMVR